MRLNLVALAFSLASVAFGQNPATVGLAGTVLDSSGAGVPEAKVRLLKTRERWSFRLSHDPGHGRGEGTLAAAAWPSMTLCGSPASGSPKKL